MGRTPRARRSLRGGRARLRHSANETARTGEIESSLPRIFHQQTKNLEIRQIGCPPRSSPATAAKERRFSCRRNRKTRQSLVDGSGGSPWNPSVVEQLAAPDMLLQYSLHAPRRGRDEVKKFMTEFRKSFPDLNFWGAAALIAEGDYVVGRWEGGGTYSGPAFSDFLMGSLPAATGRKMPRGKTRPRFASSRCDLETGDRYQGNSTPPRSVTAVVFLGAAERTSTVTTRF